MIIKVLTMMTFHSPRRSPTTTAEILQDLLILELS
jgi:hypothetical protein